MKDLSILNTKNPSFEELKMISKFLKNLAGWANLETVLSYQLLKELKKHIQKAKLEDKEALIRFTSDLQDLDLECAKIQASINLLTRELLDRNLLKKELRERLNMYSGQMVLARSFLKDAIGPDLDD